MPIFSSILTVNQKVIMRLNTLKVRDNEQQIGGKQDRDDCIKEFSIYSRPPYIFYT